MKLAMIGCGYVANMYRLTLPLHPELELVGVCDRDPARAAKMGELTKARVYADHEQACADASVDMVLNLTNPANHVAVTRAALEAGKHVFTEKPVALDQAEAAGLVALAAERGVMLSSAPCTLLADTAQTLWKAVREDEVGRIRLVYAEMEDGPVHQMPLTRWVNEAGVPWPYVDEFETGCTVEHAGYVLSWLCAMFGPAASVTAFAAELVTAEEKMANLPEDAATVNAVDDFSVACIRFASGPVARLTCGIFASHDHRLRLFGDRGVLEVDDPRSDRSPVRRRRYHQIRRKRFLSPLARKLPLIGVKQEKVAYRGSQSRDFCRGIAEMAAAHRAGRRPRLGADFALHVNELTMATQNARTTGMPHALATTFEAVEPGGFPESGS